MVFFDYWSPKDMRLPMLFGATVGAMLALSSIASAQYVPRIACLPTAGGSGGPYWTDCQSPGQGNGPVANCTCKEGFTAFNPVTIQDGGSSAGGGRPQPISASPG